MNDLEPIERIENALSSTTSVEISRAQKEVEGSIVLAKKFPRDENEAYNKIMKACKRTSLAEVAMYSYPRGGQIVKGPSIRLAEQIARSWGNITFGIRELSQDNNKQESVIEAFAWDMESNIRIVKTFTQRHGRYTKKSGFSYCDDPRDVYEISANVGARRLRSCILQIIPGDIVEAAVNQCIKTLSSQDGIPREDRIRNMIVKFDELSVTKAMLDDYLKHDVSDCDDSEIADLTVIYRTLKDKEGKRTDFFKLSQKSDIEEEINKVAEKESKKKDGANETD